MTVESLVSTILEASVTCVGLLIAIYALITPRAENLFRRKLKLLRQKKSEFDVAKQKITADGSERI